MASYKWCFVPSCSNTSRKTPNKLFFSVPRNETSRKKWWKAAKRLDTVSPTTGMYCCEDHFNVTEDMENYVKWSLVGGRLFLKPDVVPSKFQCQKTTSVPVAPRGAYTKRTRRNLINQLFLQDMATDGGEAGVLGTVDDADLPATPSEPLLSPFNADELNVERGIRNEDVGSIRMSKGTQVNIKPIVRSKLSGTDLPTKDNACSPMKRGLIDMQTSPIKIRRKFRDCTDANDSDSTAHLDCDGSGDDYAPSTDGCSSDTDCESKQKMYHHTERLMMEKSKLYLGLENEVLFIIEDLASTLKTSRRNILLCLRKIRLNEQFTILSDLFDFSQQRAGQIFREFVPAIALCCRPLIIWPESCTIRRNLPVTFRKNFRKVEAIIDCLEIEIEKPSDPVAQSLSWSEYKKCNTLKYLVSSTPDGTCNFISKGYGGRASDAAILSDSGFLNSLPVGCEVMADRGFKQIERAVREKGCKLVRPPSVTGNEKLSAAEVKNTKRVASVRIHIERVIGRLRNFQFIDPHARVSSKLANLTDDAIVIACALVNLQRPIIRM